MSGQSSYISQEDIEQASTSPTAGQVPGPSSRTDAIIEQLFTADSQVEQGQYISSSPDDRDRPTGSYWQEPQSAATSQEFPNYLNVPLFISNNGSSINVNGPNSTFIQHNGPVINSNSRRSALEVIKENITPVLNAWYSVNTGVTRGPCTPETRVGILEKIMKWAISLGVPLYWMNGMAGTGKTTIVYSASQTLEENGQLGASFFCSRSLDDCQSVQVILPTIASQLAHKYPHFASQLAQILLKEPDLQRHSLEVQIRKLIIDPWKAAVANLPSNVVVVIDALDECNDDYATFLRVLFSHSHSLPFKILLTSRPEPTIYATMTQKAESSGTLSTFILHDVEKDVVQADITKYLTSELRTYMDEAAIQFLTDMSGTLFIFAATLVRFLTAKGANILKRLELLRTTLPTSAKTKMLDLLDELYKGVLREAFYKDLMGSEVEETKGVLHDIICARVPLTRRAIAGLWNITEEEVEERLKPLRSVLLIPPDHLRPITVFHTSFPDFMLDESRSGDFCCIPVTWHGNLAERCLTVMTAELRQNMCLVQGRPENISISEETIAANISPSLRYAAVHWTDHFILSDHSRNQKLSNLNTELMTKYIFQWIECLSLSGRLAMSISSLESLEDALMKENSSSDLANLAYDLRRLIQFQGVYHIVKDSAMEIYYTAPTWIPVQSPIRVHYAGFCEKAPVVHCGLSATWTGPDQIIAIHSSQVNYIAISQDGNRIVSGSKDRTVRLYNIHAQYEEWTFNGHTDAVNCVAISGDGTFAVSGSADRTIRIWNLTTCESAAILFAWSHVSIVSISSDDKWIASGERSLVLFWDPTRDRPVHSINDDSFIPFSQSISFAPNAPRLAVANIPNSVHIWTVNQTEIVGRGLQGHSDWVRAVAWSPDGRMIVTGSRDKTACLWNADGKLLRKLQGHPGTVTNVGFLPDNERIVTTCEDAIMRIWDASTGNLIQHISGAVKVKTLAVFPDRMKIATCSYDSSNISVWNIRSEVLPNSGTRSKNDGSLPVLKAESVALSANGKWLLLFPSQHILDAATLKKRSSFWSLTETYTDGVWSKSGNRIATVGCARFSQHWFRVLTVWRLRSGEMAGRGVTLATCISNCHFSSLCFSHDDKLLFSFHPFIGAEIWDVESYKKLHTIPNEGQDIYSSSFSSNGMQLALARSLNIEIWDPIQLTLLQSLDSRYSMPSSIRFTPDDRYLLLSKNIGGFSSVNVLNTQTYDLIHEFHSLRFWEVFEDGTSCALHNNGWVYHFTSFSSQPRRLFWIPPSYRSDYGEAKDPLSFHYASLFTSSPEGIHILFPKEGEVVFFTIPRAMIPGPRD